MWTNFNLFVFYDLFYSSGVSGWMVRPPDVPDGQNCLDNLFRFGTLSLGYLFRCQAIWADPAFTFINLYIFCNLQRIINQNIHLDYVCIYFLIRKFVCLFGKLTKIENAGQRFDKIAASVPCVILYEREHLSSQFHIIKFICTRCETGLKSSPKALYSVCF